MSALTLRSASSLSALSFSRCVARVVQLEMPTPSNAPTNAPDDAIIASPKGVLNQDQSIAPSSCDKGSCHIPCGYRAYARSASKSLTAAICTSADPQPSSAASRPQLDRSWRSPLDKHS